MEFKKIIDYVEEHKKEYLEEILAENKRKLEAKNYFNSMTRDELINVLTEAGFEVEDGEGKVIFTDDEYKISNELVEKILSTDVTKINDTKIFNDLKLSHDERIEHARKILKSRKGGITE